MDGFVEDVRKPPQKLVMGPFRTVDGHVLLGPETKDPQVVGAMNMVGVKMREPNGIDVVHPGPYQLKAELGWCIHQEVPFRKGKKGPVAGPPVPWIVRGAAGAIAPDHRNAEGSACPEKGEFHAASRILRSRVLGKRVDSWTVFPHRRGREAGTEGVR